MVTHFSYTWGEDLIRELRDELVARRRILPPDSGAMCMLQVLGHATAGALFQCMLQARRQF